MIKLTNSGNRLAFTSNLYFFKVFAFNFVGIEIQIEQVIVNLTFLTSYYFVLIYAKQFLKYHSCLSHYKSTYCNLRA